MIHNAIAQAHFSPSSCSRSPVLLNAPSGIMIRSGSNGHGYAPQRKGLKIMGGPGRQPDDSVALANALVLRLRDNVAIDGIMDDRALGFQLFSREQSDLVHSLYAVPTRETSTDRFSI